VARAEVPDTNVLIQTIREPTTWLAFEQAIGSGQVWLSSVVIAEMYAGTRFREEALLLDRLAAIAKRIDRLITPTEEEWAHAGRLIARRVRLQGALQPRDHLAALLILLSAARLQGAVLTTNLRHFEAWARLAVRAGFDVVVTPYQP
jgi:predicted nucleic acid-binding protein